MDRGHTIVYCVPHFVGGCGFDELLNGTAHGGTMVNNKESGSARTDHQSEKLLLFIVKNNSRRDPITPSEESLNTFGAR